MIGRKAAITMGIAAAFISTGASALEGPVPGGISRFDHVWLIVMENHGYDQIVNNPFAEAINTKLPQVNVATNYFAIAHPSLTNYLEIVGGSNFGVLSDNYPDWHNLTCVPNLASATANTDNPASSAICPIAGTGTEAATPAIDTTNETQGSPGLLNIDGTASFPVLTNITGKTIADQVFEHGKTWKSYQESLPVSGANKVNYSDGVFDNNMTFPVVPNLNPPLSTSAIVALYAAKHNPFVYFRNIQESSPTGPNSFANVVGFDRESGLYADLASGHVPSFSFIAPNQCNDMHGRGNGTAFCNFDPNNNGTQNGLNPALIFQGDNALEKIYFAIKASPAWKTGKNAIVLVFDENDYTVAPITNRVLFAVEKNYGALGLKSNIFYTHYSLLKTLEAGLGLPCLNHACDSGVPVMTDLFGN